MADMCRRHDRSRPKCGAVLRAALGCAVPRRCDRRLAPPWAPPASTRAWRLALAEDVLDVLATLAEVDAAIAVGRRRRGARSAGSSAGRACGSYDVPALDVATVLAAAPPTATSRRSLLAADAPDLPGMMIAKLLRPLTTRPVAAAPATGAAGGPARASPRGCRRRPGCRGRTLDAPTPQALRRLARAGTDVAAAPGLAPAAGPGRPGRGSIPRPAKAGTPTRRCCHGRLIRRRRRLDVSPGPGASQAVGHGPGEVLGVRSRGIGARSELGRANASGSAKSSSPGSRSGWPQSGVAAVDAAVLGQRGPQRRGLAQPARAQLEADQRGERLLGRPAGRAATPERLGEPDRVGQAVGGGPVAPRGRPSPRPGRARSPAGPARPSARGVLRGEDALELRARCIDSGSLGSIAAHRLLDRLPVDRDARPRTPRPRSSTCPRSHGTWPKSRWWAASRRATYSRTWSSGISRPSPYAAMLAGISAAVPAGPSGRPMSPAESTSAASEPSAVPSWPPKSAPPSEATIAAIGPSWARISSGTSSPIAVTIRPATGSHSLRQTSGCSSSHSARRHASIDADAGRQRRLGLQPQVGQAQRLLDRGASAVPATAGSSRELGLGDLPGQVPVDRAGARVGEHLLQLGQERLHLGRVVRVGPPGAAGQSRSRTGGWSCLNGTR